MSIEETYHLLFLEALEECGVDNWEGYDEACSVYRQKLIDYKLLKNTLEPDANPL